MTTNKIVQFNPLPHQQLSLQKMVQLELNPIEYNSVKIKTKIGIITDPTNSGKTTTVALFLKNNYPIENKPHQYCNNKLFSVNLTEEIFLKQNLIIISQNHLDKWTKLNELLDLKSLVLKNTNEIKKNKIINNIYKNVIILDTKLKELDNSLNSPKWNRIIIEQTNDLKLYSDFLWKSNFIWFISSKPDVIYFSKKCYYKLFENIPNYCFDLVTIQNDINYILDSFNILPYEINKVLVKKDITYNKNFIQNLSFNIGKKDINKLIKNLELKSIDVSMDKKLCCPISLDKIKYPVQIQCCKNFFSLVSIVKSYYIKNQCPLCRQQIDLDDIKINFGKEKINKTTYQQITVNNGLLIFPDKNNKLIYNNYYKKIIKNFNKLNTKSIDLVEIFGNNYDVSIIKNNNLTEYKNLYIFYYGETKGIFNNIIKKLSLYYKKSKIILYQLLDLT